MENPFKNSGFTSAPKDSKKKSKNEEDKTLASPGRRYFMKKTAQAGVGALIIGLKYGPADFFKNTDAEPIDPAQYRESDHRSYVEYYTGALMGHKLGGLYTSYTGINGVVDEETAFINFANQMDSMWEAKKRISKDNTAVPGVSDALTKEYRESKVEHLTLDDYIKRIEKITGEIKKNEEFWQKIGEIKHLNASELTLVRDISLSVNGKDLMAYIMTELMPTHNGLLN